MRDNKRRLRKQVQERVKVADQQAQETIKRLRKRVKVTKKQAQERVKMAEQQAQEAIERAKAAEKKSEEDLMELTTIKEVCDNLRSYRRDYGPLQCEFLKAQTKRDNALKQVSAHPHPLPSPHQ